MRLKMLASALTVVFAASIGANCAFAAVITLLQYDFNDPTGLHTRNEPTKEANYVSGSLFTRGSSLTPPYSLINSPNINGATPASMSASTSQSVTLDASQVVATEADALNTANNSFFEFTITPGVGGHYNLQSLVFDAQRTVHSGDGGITLELRSSINSFGSPLALTSIDSDVLTNNGFLLDTVLGINKLNRSTPTTFRLYAYDEDGTSGNNGIIIDDVRLLGEVIGAPEPASMLAWLGLAGMGAVLGYRRKLAK